MSRLPAPCAAISVGRLLEMDYHSIHGKDVASFDTSGSHRLPTVAASQALNDLCDDDSIHLSTGLIDLDKALASGSFADSQSEITSGGIKRGQVTEIWGPPGTGKTALALQIVSDTIRNGQDVVWLDCFQNLPSPRLRSVVEACPPAGTDGQETLRSSSKHGRMTQYACLTLPHLMALLSRPNAKAIPEGVKLVVICGLSAVLNASLPKSVDTKSGLPKPGKGPTLNTKRLQGLQFVMKSLQKLAAVRNCASLVLSQCSTRMQSEQGATLVPGISAPAWDQGTSTRLVTFRDWTWQDGKIASIFLVGIQKLDGRVSYEPIEHVSAFNIDKGGISPGDYDTEAFMSGSTGLSGPKRKLGQTGLEARNRDEEDYGWADGDGATMPHPPPQWQGSEDILLGHELAQSEGEDGGDGHAEGSEVGEVDSND